MSLKDIGKLLFFCLRLALLEKSKKTQKISLCHELILHKIRRGVNHLKKKVYEIFFDFLFFLDFLIDFVDFFLDFFQETVRDFFSSLPLKKRK